ncbi:HPr family phosphocarrier protein [Victivallis sp. Marseille-Q1083]|uniref:HPr family phosphocarrier protein n=1 Tax=Victivallis sp. Marseille-Q1083 TaxID=2717288 RepID=UPI00158E2819|nr:HPr family phosphocarrier protein [Victivallis sp. Marseille-Q1083]
MEIRKVKIHNSAGIHCRPASVILNTINAEFPHETFTLYTSMNEAIELHGILDLISLGLQCGDEATLQVEGDRAAAAADRIAALLEHEFDFPPQ